MDPHIDKHTVTLTSFEIDILARIMAHHTTSTDERVNDLFNRLERWTGKTVGQPFAPTRNPDLYGHRPMIDLDRTYKVKARLDRVSYPDFQKYMAGYGFTSCPVTSEEYNACRTLKLTVDDAYRIACDCNAGLDFGRALIPYLQALHEKGPDCDGYDGTYDRNGNPKR